MTAAAAPSCLIAGFSMSPLLRSGDRVFLQKVERNEVEPGDIVVFSRQGKRIAHRVIRTAPLFQTQGDGNPQPDEPLAPDTELFLCPSFERDGVTTPLRRGAAGLAEFRRNQRLLRRRELQLKFARLLCRLLPFKLRAEQLEQADFGRLRVYYLRKRPVAMEQEGRWHWLSLPCACFIKHAPRRELTGKEENEERFAALFFRLLGAMVSGTARPLFLEQSEPLRRELCRRGRLQGLSPLFYYTLTDALPPEWRSLFQLDFYTQSQHDLRYSGALKQLAELFRAAGTSFIPLKGGELAYEVYPHPALRLRRDMDILFRRPEVETIFRTLQKNGWQSGEQRHPFFKRHHLPTLFHPGFPPLEPHWHILKNRTFFDPETLWSLPCSRPEPGDPLRRRLTPEAHYLLTLYNMFFDRWQFACRALLDLAYLQKKYPLDRDLIRSLNREWKLNLDLGLCYRLFPEMFPEEQRLFTSDAEIPERARYAIRRLALLEYPESIMPFLANSSGAAPARKTSEPHRRGLFRHFRKKRTETEKLRALLAREFPQATELKLRYRREKDC